MYKSSITLYGIVLTLPVTKAGVNPLVIGIGGGILFATFPTFPTLPSFAAFPN
ncbi:hypothetical protein H1Z61_16950 [Bacillus aquiflavi]|uniref:Uncharacterized protein n=1 Tax=Bacillus aquiflavi TaxID=2672567 RepID=A0A6B3VYC7_9BACI|nr:hypothetical protein [Bacillus aquiflavi]MBA4538767.1 hypothetical protein [Bacillus aquiflavi]NEY83119.1 hypothetical protein [Bacillus aquiflavi]UAC48641.1 hypothetical protein K6959_01190 [Bacillus aquiflavi]